MGRLVPRSSAMGLVVAPTVWLFYFVATFLVVSLGCAQGWEQHLGQLHAQRALLWIITLLSLALVLFATYESWRNLQAMSGPDADPDLDEEARERQRFLAHAGLFLCALSLLGVLWGSINMAAFDSCIR